MEHQRTFHLTRLYHQFLKPKSIPSTELPFLVSRLYEAGFIEVFRGREFEDGEIVERYSETPKLTEREHRKELFSIIQAVSDGITR